MTLLAERYELGEMLGRGAAGVVFKSIDTQTNTTVAIKQITIGKMKKQKVSELTNEAKIMSQYQHANLVRLLDFIQEKKNLYFILEFMPHGSLSKTCRQVGTFPEDMLGIYIYDALKGLAYLHSNNIIHRDIKGDNLLLASDMRVCIADFGIAKMSTSEDEVDAVGTPYWLAPEVILMTDSTTASDIWSLGCTIIELLTGDPPYGKLTAMAAVFHMVKDDHPPIPEGISRELESFLMLCFEKDVSIRSTATSLLNHKWLEAARTQDGVVIDYNKIRESIRNRKSVVIPRDITDTEKEEAIMSQEWEEFEIGENENKYKVLAIISKLEQKLELVEKRIKKRKFQENSLLQLRKLYGNLSDQVDKQLKFIRESLFYELRAEKELTRHMAKLKEGIYPVAVAVESGTEFHKGDKIFILNRINSELWDAEFVHNRNHVTVMSKDFCEQEQKEVTWAVPVNGTMAPSAEEVLQSVEAKQRMGKLGGFFGASGTEIDRGLRESSGKALEPPPPPQPVDHQPSAVNSALKRIGFSLGLKIPSESDLTKIQSLTDISLNVVPDELVILSAKKKFVEKYPALRLENQEFLRFGIVGFQLNEKDKVMDRFVFLYSETLIIARKSGSKYKLDYSVVLPQTRIVLLSSAFNPRGSLSTNAPFQLEYNKNVYTIRPNEDESASWFVQVREIIRTFQRKRLSEGRTVSLGSFVWSPNKS